MNQIVGRECGCEDFPCCGHGLTEADIQARYRPREDDWDFDVEEDVWE